MSNIFNKYVIVGATSAIAHQCSRIWAQRDGAEFVLVGRNPDRLEPLAADLRARNPSCTARVESLDFLDPQAIDRLTRALEANSAIGTVLIAHGSLPDQWQCQNDLAASEQALLVNGVSPALLAEAFAGAMQRAGQGRLCIISSVAGERGRKSNYVYGAAKGLVSRYAEGLQHRLASTPVKVTLVKPGPTDTPMTAHLKQQGARLASAEAVAAQIVKAVDAGKPVVYTPAKWALIMLVIRSLPRFVFNRMDI